MFKVINKESKKVYDVYNIEYNEDSNYIRFLIYDSKIGWIFTSASGYEPYIPFVPNVPQVDYSEFVHTKGTHYYDNHLTTTSSACDACAKNPKNGGDGICHCILGLQTVYATTISTKDYAQGGVSCQNTTVLETE